MATTVTAPVTNNIDLASQFLPILDEIYKRASLTARLDTSSEMVRFIGAKTVNLFSTNMVGLSNYSRNGGFVPGDVNGSWEPYTINVDRGRSYMVDVMDNDETIGMAFGTLVGETERTQIVPEVDAYRFAKYADASGLKATPTTIATSTNVIDMIDEATAAMDDNEVPTEGRILFVSSNCYKQIKKNITRYIQNGEADVNTDVGYYNDMPVISVPQSRFNTAITLNAPTTAAGVGGYTLAGVPINFMIVHPSAVMQLVKHVVPRIFSPEVNQESDAWKFDYRIYHDCWVKDNKVNGIYLSAAAPTTAMAVSASTAAPKVGATTTVTLSNAQGTVRVVSSDETKATATEKDGTVTITGVAVGSATLTITDGIGQTATVAVTVSAS